MTDEARFDDESPTVGPRSLDMLPDDAVAKVIEQQEQKENNYFALGFLTQNVQVDDTKIDRWFFKYTKRRMVNGAGVNRSGSVPAIFDFAFWSGEYPSYEIGIGHHWVLRVAFRFAYKESIELRLEFLKQFTLNLMGWWPGA